ncbi:TPA: hypothetical protein ROG05_001869 [Enterobacter soli]|jgi:hypothetical protein|uniref:hypothetical protein n=1 Tax=Enterobacter soli TaxID=885040 RepID=UPI0021494C87|nr:hypothetical protein [Enterobacter soli]MCR1316421.1 hypothetical protein [Enterobacter soli]HDR2472764.1 hypothetical protein [Enterobacter soli]HDX4049497.1 hypothetical protein [Enterobacter soli]
MIDLKDVVIITGLIAIILGTASIIASALNKKRYKEICKLYKEKFGDLPPMVQIFDDVNTLYVDFAYSVKMQFIFKPLLWNKSSNMTKNDDKDFIRGLPRRLIGPFYVEIYLAVVSLIFFIIGGLLMLAIKHGWV